MTAPILHVHTVAYTSKFRSDGLPTRSYVRNCSAGQRLNSAQQCLGCRLLHWHKPIVCAIQMMKIFMSASYFGGSDGNCCVKGMPDSVCHADGGEEQTSFATVDTMAQAVLDDGIGRSRRACRRTYRLKCVARTCSCCSARAGVSSGFQVFDEPS